MTVVLHHLGDAFADSIRAGFPDVEVVAVPGDGPINDDVRGDVLATTVLGCQNLATLCARGVRWVHALGTGVDQFPFHALAPDAVLTCTRGASAEPIAEYVLAAMLDFEKRLDSLFVSSPPNRWGFTDLGGLRGRTVSVVGLGGIGTAVARRCVAFDMTVLGVRRSSQPTPVSGVELVTLSEALARADHLVLAAPSTPATTRLLDDTAFSTIKPGAHLVNIARGALIDQDSLRRSLDTGVITRATLDVCDPEPLPDGHWLYSHPSVRLSPHISWSAPGALEVLRARFAENLTRFTRGEPLAGVVDRDERY